MTLANYFAFERPNPIPGRLSQQLKATKIFKRLNIPNIRLSVIEDFAGHIVKRFIPGKVDLKEFLADVSGYDFGKTAKKNFGEFTFKAVFPSILKAARKVGYELYPDRKLVNSNHFEDNLRVILSKMSGVTRLMIVGIIVMGSNKTILRALNGSKTQSAMTISLAARVIAALVVDNPIMEKKVGVPTRPKHIQKDQPEKPDFMSLPNAYNSVDSLPHEALRHPDVVCIGSGPSLAAVVEILRKHPNKSVLIIESGGHLSNEEKGGLTQMRRTVLGYEQAGLTTALGFDFSNGISNALFGASIPMPNLVGGGPGIFSGTIEDPEPYIIRQIFSGMNVDHLNERAEEMLGVGLIPKELMPQGSIEFLETALSMGYSGRPLNGMNMARRRPNQTLCEGRAECPSQCPIDAKENPFLREALQYPNVILVANTEAQRIEFKGDEPVLIPVISKLSGRKFNINVEGEARILVGAGTFGSAKLLARSGISPKGRITFHPASEVSAFNPDMGLVDPRGRLQSFLVEFRKNIEGVQGANEGVRPYFPLLLLASPGIIGERAVELLNLYPRTETYGIMMSEGDDSGGSFIRIPGFNELQMIYKMSQEDRLRMKMLAFKTLEIAAHTKRGLFLRALTFPLFPSKLAGEFSQLGFFHRDEIERFKGHLLDNKTFMLNLGFHPLGSSTGNIDRRTGLLLGRKRTYVIDGSSITITKVNPTKTIVVNAMDKGDKIARDM